MTTWELVQQIKSKKALPHSTESPGEECSNSELKRWFIKGSIVINNKRVTKDEEIEFPAELVFHPNGNSKCTSGCFIED